MCCSFMLDLGRSAENCWQGESFFARSFGVCADFGEAMFPTNRSREKPEKRKTRMLSVWWLRWSNARTIGFGAGWSMLAGSDWLSFCRCQEAR